jgi:hypothetical protein
MCSPCIIELFMFSSLLILNFKHFMFIYALRCNLEYIIMTLLFRLFMYMLYYTLLLR